MVSIKPISVPTRGIGKYFLLELSNNLRLPGDSAHFYWEIYTEVEMGMSEYVPGTMILNGNLTMPKEIYDQWGTDDNYAINWALNELNLQKL